MKTILANGIVLVLSLMALGFSQQYPSEVTVCSDGCDYIVDGIDDNLEVKRALAYCVPIGCDVVLGPQEIVIGKAIAVNSGLRLRGSGMDATVVKLDDDVPASSVIIVPHNWHDVTISDLTVDANGQNQTDQHIEGNRGIELTRANNVRIANVRVINHPGTGIKVFRSSNIWVENNRIEGSKEFEKSQGIGIGGSGTHTADVWVRGNTVTGHTRTGIQVRAGGGNGLTERVFVDGNTVINNDLGGLALGAPQTVRNVIYSRNYVYTENAPAVNFQTLPPTENIKLIGNILVSINGASTINIEPQTADSPMPLLSNNYEFTFD